MYKSKQAYLDQVLATHKMSHIEDLVQKHRDKKNNVKEKIKEHYLNKVYNSMDSGSFAKHTAINIKFDWDLVVPYKKDSFETLEKMLDDIHEFLEDTYNDEAYIRRQKVSIGLEFFTDEDGDVVNIDVVPGRELNEKQYDDDKKLNLYVNSQYGNLDEKSYIQTNIKAQIDHITAKNNERQIIRLLKTWKKHNSEAYKSFFLELFTIKAFEKETIEGNLWDKLKKVMEYIRDNVTKDSFTLKDPGNSSNDLMDTLNEYERDNLSSKMERMINNIEENDDYLESYFPKNSEFNFDEDEEENSESDTHSNESYDDEGSDGGYCLKSSALGASVPPNNTRFG